MYQTTQSLASLLWRASNGSREAQRKLSEDPRVSKQDREFWKYKSEGGAAFSPLSLTYQLHVSKGTGEQP